MSRKISLLTFIALFLCWLPFATKEVFAQGDTKIVVHVDQPDVQIGDEFKVYIQAENSVDLFGLQLSLDYDPDRVEVVPDGIAIDPNLTVFGGEEVDEAAGVLTYPFINTGSTTENMVDLPVAEITFKALEKGPVTFNLRNIKAVNTDIEEIHHNTQYRTVLNINESLSEPPSDPPADDEREKHDDKDDPGRDSGRDDSQDRSENDASEGSYSRPESGEQTDTSSGAASKGSKDEKEGQSHTPSTSRPGVGTVGASTSVSDPENDQGNLSEASEDSKAEQEQADGNKEDTADQDISVSDIEKESEEVDAKDDVESASEELALGDESATSENHLWLIMIMLIILAISVSGYFYIKKKNSPTE